MKKLRDQILLALKGIAMGIAEVIPGVSGGTIAFITGIYEQLLNAIKSVLGPEWFRAWRTGGLALAWQTIDGGFLLVLVLGMAIGLVTGVFGVTHFLETYPVLLWAFFFGLIIASTIYIGRQVSHWSGLEVTGMVLAAVVAYWITVATPSQGNGNLLFVFLAGAIAISALILPGISGSFILLLLGMYTLIIPSLKSLLAEGDLSSLVILIVFGLGCLTGLATFSRLLSWTFKHYPNPTLAVLTGFMIGSLNKIWPWRNVVSTRIDSSGEEVPFLERSVPPGQFEGDPMIAGAILMMIVGFALVLLLSRLDNGKALQPTA